MIYSKIGILISIGIIILLLVLSFFSFKPKFIFPVSKLSPIRYRSTKVFYRGIVVSIILLPLEMGFVSSKSVIVDKPLPVQIILDVSLSMSAYDINPSRFSAAKTSLAELIRRLDGYDVSLITFSGIPFVAVPFSHDTQAVLAHVEKMSLSDFPPVKEFLGTALGDALLLGVKNLQSVVSPSSLPGIILLITDGDSNEGYDPAQVTTLLQKLGIPVFALGIGNNNYLIGYDQRNQPISTSLNTSLLQQIATQTSGAFSRGLTTQDIDQFFQSLLTNIKAHESSHIAYTYWHLDTFLLTLCFLSLIGLLGLRITSLQIILRKK